MNKNLFILIATILALIGVIIWSYDYMTKIEANHITEPVTEEEKQSEKETGIETKKEELQEGVLPEVIWNKYINDELGFSIDIPNKKVYGLYSCDPKKVIQVPVKVFEDNENGVVYISQEYYYLSKYDNELHRHVGECKKIIYSLELLRNEKGPRGFKPRLGWAIVIKTVKNEDELDKFIKENYGSGCRAEDKKLWETDYQQLGAYAYDIHIRGEGDNRETTLGTTSCAEAWTARHKVLYFPEENKVMSVKLGQESTFQTNPHLQPHQSYDQKMIDSFRFE